jgi:hypothetical protein
MYKEYKYYVDEDLTQVEWDLKKALMQKLKAFWQVEKL